MLDSTQLISINKNDFIFSPINNPETDGDAFKRVKLSLCDIVLYVMFSFRFLISKLWYGSETKVNFALIIEIYVVRPYHSKSLHLYIFKVINYSAGSCEIIIVDGVWTFNLLLKLDLDVYLASNSGYSWY